MLTHSNYFTLIYIVSGRFLLYCSPTDNSSVLPLGGAVSLIFFFLFFSFSKLMPHLVPSMRISASENPGLSHTTVNMYPITGDKKKHTKQVSILTILLSKELKGPDT